MHVWRMNYSIPFGMHAVRQLPPFLVLVGLMACPTSAPAHAFNSQVAFLNHGFATGIRRFEFVLNSPGLRTSNMWIAPR